LHAVKDENTTKGGVLAMNEKLIDFIAELYFHKMLSEAAATNDSPNEENELSLSVDEPSVVAQDLDDDDNFFLSVLNSSSCVPESNTKDSCIQASKDDLRELISKEVLQYNNYCNSIEWKDAIEAYPTQKYIDLKKANGVITNKMFNPQFIWTTFNVMDWWCNYAVKLFPRVAVAAFIILPKAAHNGFQERVFSIGTYVDTKLQKKRAKVHYEMDVIQRINAPLMQEAHYYCDIASTIKKSVDDLLKSMECQQTLQATNYDLDNNDEIDTMESTGECSDDLSSSNGNNDNDFLTEKECMTEEWHDFASDCDVDSVAKAVANDP